MTSYSVDFDKGGSSYRSTGEKKGEKSANKTRTAAKSKNANNTVKSVLIVEDEAPLLEILCEEFEREKFEVLRADNGRVGLDLALSKHPAVIILDLLMPEMSGYELLRSIRADSWGKNALIFVLTNLSNPELQDDIVGAAELIMVKTDFRLQEVIDRVSSAIKTLQFD